MANQTTPQIDPIQALSTLALRYPEAQEGIACQGTALQSRSFKARDKAFLFIGGTGPSYTVRLKMRESLAEAIGRAAREPGRYKIGAHAWVAVTISADAPPRPGLLERWLEESYRAVVDRKLVARLPELWAELALE